MAIRAKRRLDALRLDKILEALQEIEWHFDNEGFSGDDSSNKDVHSSETAEGLDDDSNDDLDEENGSGPGVFDAEEIEVAIGAFITHLIEVKIVKRRKQAPSLADVFSDFFADDHEVVKAAIRFEDHVEGYSGWVSEDDMREAYGYLVGIKDALTRVRERLVNE